ncbi:hypothetical protein RDI58_013519 [Solanum bulbocastanum]|uniref:FMN-dependent dehydrogenase domain-containing protein n=1 Tax=Solanum bulbocastanum TaxID=147425 RepID=A0AAN8TL86_SOLBU
MNVLKIGRPVIYGLATNGEFGVKQGIEMLNNELEQTIALAGCCTTAEIIRNYVKTDKERLLLAYGFFGYLENFGTSSPCFTFVSNLL